MALAYDSMSARRMQLAQDPARHVEWIWREQAQGGPGFAEWLNSDTPMFWITGKPGSGKSTLMKHVAESSRATSLLPTRPGRQWLVVHFYFDFRAGSGIANSVDGLLKSILFQLAQQSNRVADTIRHDLKRTDYIAASHNLDREELFHLLQLSTSAISSVYKVCGFVDGLDEFSGRHLDLLRFMDTLIHHGISKLCVASRPEPTLAQYLGDRPHFEMQAYNSMTIQAYVKDVFQHVPAQIHSSVNLDALTADVVHASEGVILWARLAMYHLIDSLSAGETREEVYQTLNGFPRELNDVYERLLKSLELSKQLESAMFLHLIQTGLGSMSTWDLHCAMVFLRDSGMLPSWPRQALSYDNFIMRLRSRTGSMVDINDRIVRYAIPSEPRDVRARLFHRTLDTYLTTTGWVRHTLMQADLSIQPEGMWLQICTSCLLQNELSDATFSRLFSTCSVAPEGALSSPLVGLQPTVFEDQKTFSVLMRRNSIESATDLLDYALRMYPTYLRQAVQYNEQSLGDCHWRVMGSQLMSLHPWMEWMEAQWNRSLGGSVCSYAYFNHEHCSLANVAVLRPAQRAVILALMHHMYKQATNWLYMKSGSFDDVLAKEAIKMLIHVAGKLKRSDEINHTEFFALLNTLLRISSFIDDSDLAQAVYCTSCLPSWVTNLILRTIFMGRGEVKQLRSRWVPGALLPRYFDKTLRLYGSNLLGLWVFSASMKTGFQFMQDIINEQLTILLDSGLDINDWCTGLGPPLHTMLMMDNSGGDDRIAKIQRLLNHGADATIPGPHGTLLETARYVLRLVRPGRGTVRDIDNEKVLQFLWEHKRVVAERQRAGRALPNTGKRGRRQ